MGQRTIYVKDEAMWERAKKLAGKEGLSGLVAEAVAAFVEKKQNEEAGLTLHEVRVNVGPSVGGTAVRFFGQKVLDTVIGNTPEEEASAEVYVTKAGNLVAILRGANTGEPYDFHKHASLEELRDSSWFQQIPPDDRAPLLESVADALGETSTVWID